MRKTILLVSCAAYDDFEVNRVVEVEMNPASKQSQLEAAIAPVADRLLLLHEGRKSKIVVRLHTGSSGSGNSRFDSTKSDEVVAAKPGCPVLQC